MTDDQTAGTPEAATGGRLSAPEPESGAEDVPALPDASEGSSSASGLVERLEWLKARFAEPLPSAEELAAGVAEDRALVPRIRAVRPGVPAHHVLAVLETLRTIRHYDRAGDDREAAPATVWIAATHGGLVVHATEAGAREAAIEAWRAIRDADDPDGPYTWEPGDGQEDVVDLLIHLNDKHSIDTGFRVCPAPVCNP